MGKCEKCGMPIDDKYKFCIACLDSIKGKNKDVGTDELIKTLGKLNNNLYFLRRAAAIALEFDYNKRIVWDKAKKDFVVEDIKNIE